MSVRSARDVLVGHASAGLSTAPPVPDTFKWVPALKFLEDAKSTKYPTKGPLSPKLEALLDRAAKSPSGIISEHEAYDILEAVGLNLLPRYFHPIGRPFSEAAQHLEPGAKYVIKAMITDCLHKTDIGAVGFNVTQETASERIAEFHTKFAGKEPLEGFLLTKQIDFYKGGLAAGEYLFSSYEDPDFGPIMCFGIGGTGVEYSKTVMQPGKSHIFIPTKCDISEGSSFAELLEDLPAAQLISGQVRGIKKSADVEQIRQALQALQKLVLFYSRDNPHSPWAITDVEVNPLVAGEGNLYALDAVIIVKPNPNYGRPAELVHTYDTEHSGKPISQLNALIRPKTAAVVGASTRNAISPGSIILRKLGEAMPHDKLYAIHPRESVVAGIQAVPTLAEAVKANGGPVDLFVVGIPAASVGEVVVEAIDKNQAKCILTISGGFSETKEGAKLEEGIRAALRTADERGLGRPLINGPNTVGSYSADGVDTVFTPVAKSSRTFMGARDAAIIAQSGAFLITRLSNLADRVNPDLCISVGNQMDVSGTDALEFILDHDDKSVIGMYIEGFQPGEGLRLINLVARARSEGRLVILYKSARSRAGKSAVAGHTASMAGDYDLFASLLERAGAIVCQSVDDFESIYTCAALWGRKRLGYLSARVNAAQEKGDKRIVVRAVSNAGFETGAIADHLFINAHGTAITDKSPVAIPDWPEEQWKELDDLWRKNKMEEIVDIAPVLDVTPTLGNEGWGDLMCYLAGSPHVDAGIFSIVPEVAQIKTLGPQLDDPDSILNGVKRAVTEFPEFPAVVSIESGWKYDEIRKRIELEAGVPCFTHADVAARTVARIVHSLRK